MVADNGTINAHNIKKHLQNNNLNLNSYDNPSNITVNQEITWNKNTLTLHADNDIHINKTLNGTGTAKLALEYEQAYYGGNSDYHIKNGAKVNLSAGLNLNVKQGSGGKIQKFWVIYNLPKNNNYTFDYENIAIGKHIDISSSKSLPNFHGFTLKSSSGKVHGLGNVISGLNINSKESNIGLIRKLSNGEIRDVSLVNANVVGANNVGLLAGLAVDNTKLHNITAVGNVKGNAYVGSIAGYAPLSDFNNVKFINGNIGGSRYVGGIAGYTANISNAVVKDSKVNGTDCVGGLAGYLSGDINENLGASAVDINWKYLDKLGYFREISKFYNTKTNHKIPDNFKAQDCHLMQVNCFKRVYTKLEGIKYKQLTKAEQPKPKKLNIDNIDFDNLRKQFSLSTEIRNSDLDVMVKSVFAGGGVKLAVGYYSMALDRLNAINKFAYNNMAKGNTLQFIEQGDFPIWITSEEFIKKNKDLTPMEQKLAKEKIENMSSIVSVVGDVFYNIDESDLTNMNGEALTARARVASRLIGADKNLQSFDGLIKLLDMGQDTIEIYGHGENIYNLTNDGMDLYKRLSKIKKDGRELHKELVKTAIEKELVKTAIEIDKLMFADNPSSHEYLNDVVKIISDNHKNKEIAKMLLDPVKEGIKNAKNSNGVTVITEVIPNIKTAMDKIKTVAVALEIAKKHNEKLAEQKEIENFLKHASHNDKSHNDKVAYLTQIAILKANPNINLRGQKIFTFSKNWWGKYRLVETEIR